MDRVAVPLNVEGRGRFDSVEPPSAIRDVARLSITVPRSAVELALADANCDGIIPTEVGHAVLTSSLADDEQEGTDGVTLLYTRSGRGCCRIGDASYGLGPGQLIVIPPKLRHQYAALAADPWSVDWIRVEGARVHELVDAESSQRRGPVHHLGHDPHIEAKFTELFQVLQTNHAPASLHAAGEALRHWLTALLRRSRRAQDRTSTAMERVAASIVYMQNHLAVALDVRTLSQMAQLSPSHYTLLFRRQTGSPPLDYFIRLRMRVAAELIDESNESIKSIAAKVGYRDPLYFSRVFASVFGVPPSDLRRKRAARVGQ